jgi:aryl-alcohol dehydrogenase-like predicted oxidoreductase
MKMRTLGKSGLKVSELSLGGFFTSSFGGDFEQSKRAILAALRMGINYIDTAPNYADSEEVIGKALEGFAGDTQIIMSTKIGGKPQPFLPQDRNCLMQSIENSLKTLHRDYIDIVMIHEPDRPRQYDWWTDPENYDGPAMELLQDLKKQRTIGFIGLAGTTVHEMDQIVKSDKFDILLTAFNYNLLWREAETELLPDAADREMGIIIGSPLHMGALAQRYDEEIVNGAKWLNTPRREQFKKLYVLADEINMSLPELGLRFLLSNTKISCVLTGAKSVEEVEQNVQAAEKGPLPVAIIKRIDEIAASVPFRPFEEPFALPFSNDYKGPGLVNSSWI